MLKLRKQGPGPGAWPLLSDVGGFIVVVAGSEFARYNRVGDCKGALEV